MDPSSLNDFKHSCSTDPLTGRPLKPTMGELLAVLMNSDAQGVCLHLTPARKSQGADVAIAWSKSRIEPWTRLSVSAFPLEKPQHAIHRLIHSFIDSPEIARQAESLGGHSRAPIHFEEEDFADEATPDDEHSRPYRNDREPKALLTTKAFEPALRIPSKDQRMLLIHASIEWDGVCSANPCLLFAKSLDMMATPLWGQGTIVESPKPLITWSEYGRTDVVNLLRSPDFSSLLISAMDKAEINETARSALPDSPPSHSI